MPTPRKPITLRKIQGTAHRNKHRQNADQPIPDCQLAGPPGHLTERQQEIWQELTGIMYRGVLGRADGVAMELLCRMVEEMRHDFDNMNAAKLTQLSSLLGRFGMTPSDRTKVVVPKAPQANPFEGL
ncbi:hypothetical protein [Alloalcanivorax venustensis]|jgi:hypothetical protein|uniref:hypothetical protein n=1 Tax=Alloalcanivorax venustensis TaxID=172371 RepID=UPI003515E99D